MHFCNFVVCEGKWLWTLTENGGALETVLSPLKWPHICNPPEIPKFEYPNRSSVLSFQLFRDSSGDSELQASINSSSPMHTLAFNVSRTLRTTLAVAGQGASGGNAIRHLRVCKDYGAFCAAMSCMWIAVVILLCTCKQIRNRSVRASLTRRP